MDKLNKKLLIFDCDGVLNLNQNEAYKHVIRQSLLETEVPIVEELLAETMKEGWGSPPQHIAVLYINKLPNFLNDNPRAEAGVEESYYEVLRRDFADIIQPVPGAAPMLTRLKDRYKLALNTAADEEVLYQKVMPKLGIDPFEIFQGGIITALNLKKDKLPPKPEPHTTQALLAYNQVDPEEAVMIGDSPADILTAYFAGVHDVVVPTTGMISPQESLLYVKEYGVEVVPNVTYLESERLLGQVAVSELIPNGR